MSFTELTLRIGSYICWGSDRALICPCLPGGYDCPCPSGQEVIKITKRNINEIWRRIKHLQKTTNYRVDVW